MKNWKRLLALLLSGVMALSLFACNSGGSAESPSGSPSADASAGPDASPAIVADLSQPILQFAAGVSPADTMLTINGQDIPADLFLYMVATNCMNMQSYLPYFGMTLSDVADTVLEESVSLTAYHVLIRQKAAELGCLPTDAQNSEVRALMGEADMDFIASYWGLTDESAEFFFAINTYYDNVLNATTHEPTTEELNRDYLYRVKHILVKTVNDSMNPLPEDQLAEKKAQAEDLLAQLQAASDLPAKFDELMNEYSEDRGPDGSLNGADGYLAAPGDMVAEFEAASKALAEGGLSGIVESTYGYHIILRLPTDVTAEELDVHPEYAENFRQSALEELIAQWKDASVITRSDALSNLDVPGFYDRMAAYQQALEERDAPAESDGVG